MNDNDRKFMIRVEARLSALEALQNGYSPSLLIGGWEVSQREERVLRDVVGTMSKDDEGIYKEEFISYVKAHANRFK